MMHIPDLNKDRLEEMVNSLSRAITKKLPGDLPEKIMSLSFAESDKEFRDSARSVAEEAVDQSRMGETIPNGSVEQCPCVFCGSYRGNKSGIEKHLDPTCPECPVLGTILTMATVRFGASEAGRREREKAARIRLERSKNRILVNQVTGPETFESVWNSRSAAAMVFAEGRLSEMGFTKDVITDETSATTTSWSLEGPGFFLLADPREEGVIRVRAWPIKLKDMYKTRKSRRAYMPTIDIRDGWKNDLKQKLFKRVEVQLEMDPGSLSAFC